MTWLPLVACLLLAVLGSAVARPPNIVFILADDLGFGEVSAYPADSPHGRIPTPHIDSLARDGMLFTQAYAGEAVCAPSRCSLLTGRHTGHAAIRGNKKVNGKDFPLPSNTTTVMQVMSDAGYETAIIGKWGLGYNGTTGAPWSQHVDYFYGQLDQANCHNYYPRFVWEGWSRNGTGQKIDLPQNDNASKRRCTKPHNTCAYSHTLFAERSLRYLADYGARVREDASTPPLLLFVTFTIPHAGGWRLHLESGMPVPSAGNFSYEDWPEVEQDHAAAISLYEDAAVGDILSVLAKEGLDENTAVFFTSDNGAHNEGGHDYRFFDSSGPLRGYKRSLYEGGIRSPMLVRWPGYVKAGSVSDYTWAFWDVMATFADMGGAAQPPSDGVSILPTLLGQTQPPKDFLYWEYCTNGSWGHAVRAGAWKGVSFVLDSPMQLYDLSVDIGETTDVAYKNPSVVETLQEIAEEAHEDDPNWPLHCRSLPLHVELL